MTIDELAKTVCPERKQDFLNFVIKGENGNGFGKHAENCSHCQAALDAGLKNAIEALQELGKSFLQ